MGLSLWFPFVHVLHLLPLKLPKTLGTLFHKGGPGPRGCLFLHLRRTRWHAGGGTYPHQYSRSFFGAEGLAQQCCSMQALTKAVPGTEAWFLTTPAKCLTLHHVPPASRYAPAFSASSCALPHPRYVFFSVCAMFFP